MVLFKRKPIEFFPAPETPVDLDSPVWYIPETGEWFAEYDDYLTRLDYYNTRKFVCETTGITNYTFWEALQIENREIQKVERMFPEAVKEPILRYVQFSEVQRIDVLIDEVYYKFKNDFFPGDQVNVKIPGSGAKDRGVVKEKARFNAITLPDGQERKAYCQYRVLLNSSDKEITCDEGDLARDRMAFTKLYIRGFFKLALIKSPRVGSPWVVKDHYAKKYRISADYPAHMSIFKKDLDALPIRKRARNDLYVNLQPLYPLPNHNKKRKAENGDAYFKQNMFSYVAESAPETPADYNSWRHAWLTVLHMSTVFIDDSHQNEILKDSVVKLFNSVGSTIVYKVPAPNSDINIIVTKRTYSPSFNYGSNDFFHDINPASCKVWNFEKVLRFFKSLEFTFDENKAVTHPELPDMTTGALRPLLPKDAFAKLPTPSALRQQTANGEYGKGSPAPQTAPKKPALVDDLTLPFQTLDTVQRPNWVSIENQSITKVSELLESWCFLNIYRRALVLDNFTLDDYITAVSWRNTDMECSLLKEIFCATMKCILNDDIKVGGNNTHGISKDENAIGDGENYLILIPRRGGYSVEKNVDEDEVDGDDVKKENSAEVDGDVSMEDGVKEEDSNGEKKIKKEEEGVDQEEEEEEEEEEDEEEETTHIVEKYLFYKKKTWQERLRKRQFKDGQWLITLLGVLSLVEHVSRYSESIQEIFNALAPIENAAVSPATLEAHFYEDLSTDLRISAITILCELLTSGVVIRNFIDKSLEDATQARKERIEVVREYKSQMEQASAINKRCIEVFNENKHLIKRAPVDPNAKKNRGGRPPQLKERASEDELQLAQVSKEFAKLITERAGFLSKANEAKAEKKELEFKLSELDIQRVTFVGRDRLFNRYWWFESNGLPTIRYNKKITEDDEDVDDENDSAEEDEDEADDEVTDETYLVGRLFVQGPSDTDRLKYLNLTDELVQKWVGEKEDDEDGESDNASEKADDKEDGEDLEQQYREKCSELFGYQIDGKVIKARDGKVLVDEYGATSVDLIGTEMRKFIEERPSPLVNKSTWHFIDKPEDLDKFLASLNVQGEREFQLHKELDVLKDNIKASMDARIKALGLEKKSNDEIMLEEKINAIVISDVEIGESDEGEDDAEEGEEEAEEPEEVVVVEEPVVFAQPQEPDDGDFADSEEQSSDADADGGSSRKTRSSRRISSRNKRKAQEMERARSSRVQRRTRSARHPAPAVESLPVVTKKRPAAKRPVKKSRRQMLKLHEEKVRQREKLVRTLENLRNNRNEVRCLEWVNSSAINEFGEPHFEASADSKAKARQKRK